MPRSNRPRRSRGGPPSRSDESYDISRAVLGNRRTESKRDGLWNVQPVPAAAAVKVYTCPGCVIPIQVGTAHIVAWRADGLLGESSDLAARRHWHSHCWKIY